MKKLITAIRLLLAIALAIFGADKFLHFMPRPDAPAQGQAFLAALGDAGYIFPIIGGAFLLSAALLLTKHIALAVVILTPITLNIILYHVRYDLAGIGPGAVIASMQLIMLWTCRGQFITMIFASKIMR